MSSLRKIRISSAIRRDSLEALKRLIYLNPHQQRDEDGIRRALQAYGQPRIREKENALSIHVGDCVPQSLFAYDDARSSTTPVGVVIFSRTDPETIFIIQISVDPEYTLQSEDGTLGVGWLLLDKVRAIAAQVVGIRKIKLFYRGSVELRV